MNPNHHYYSNGRYFPNSLACALLSDERTSYKSTIPPEIPQHFVPYVDESQINKYVNKLRTHGSPFWVAKNHPLTLFELQTFLDSNFTSLQDNDGATKEIFRVFAIVGFTYINLSDQPFGLQLDYKAPLLSFPKTVSFGIEMFEKLYTFLPKDGIVKPANS